MLWMLPIACGPGTVTLPPAETVPTADTSAPVVLVVTDLADSSGYVDTFFGSWQRGRAVVVLDYDLDGRNDVFSGNPGDTSFLLHNTTEPGGDLRFAAGQILAEDIAMWSGAAADYDNDGDPDLYVAVGGNETRGFDRLYRNDRDPDAPFVEVSRAAGIDPRKADGTPLETATAGANWFDADNDGWLDLFAPAHLQLAYYTQVVPEDGVGLNQLWHARGDGTFEDVAWASGLRTQHSSRNSAVLDYDGDGDLDLFENNFTGPNVLWRNEWIETGTLSFTDVTAEASLGGGDLAWPKRQSSMCAIAADLDNDGFEDLVLFRRGPKDDPDEPDVHDIGHMLWMNVGGAGFVEVASYTDLNDSFYYRDHNNLGVMGCQIDDVDADGFPDIFVGNGGPDGGGHNQLFVSTERTLVDIPGVGEVRVPQFEDWSTAIDFPPASASDTDVAAFPYRTHGSAFGDLDGDGLLELLVHNGGPSTNGTDAEMQEPNRLFHFRLPDPPHFLEVRLISALPGVNRDGIGARVHITVSRSSDGASWELYRTRRAGSGFGACNDPDLLFGLADADTIEAIEVTWPDGSVQNVDPDGLDRLQVIQR